MSAEDHLSPVQFYHGTNAEYGAGDEVVTGHQATFDSGTMPHVYATGSVGSARAYAMSRSRIRGGQPHVYEVQPADDVEPDPEGKSAGVQPYRASRLTVLRELSHGELRGR